MTYDDMPWSLLLAERRGFRETISELAMVLLDGNDAVEVVFGCDETLVQPFGGGAVLRMPTPAPIGSLIQDHWTSSQPLCIRARIAIN
jgi:hypothetical protein